MFPTLKMLRAPCPGAPDGLARGGGCCLEAGAWNLGILIGCGVGGGSFSDALHARGVCSLSAEAWVGAACAWGQLTMWMVFTANYTCMADAALYE